MDPITKAIHTFGFKKSLSAAGGITIGGVSIGTALGIIGILALFATQGILPSAMLASLHLPGALAFMVGSVVIAIGSGLFGSVLIVKIIRSRRPGNNTSTTVTPTYTPPQNTKSAPPIHPVRQTLSQSSSEESSSSTEESSNKLDEFKNNLREGLKLRKSSDFKMEIIDNLTLEQAKGLMLIFEELKGAILDHIDHHSDEPSRKFETLFFEFETYEHAGKAFKDILIYKIKSQKLVYNIKHARNGDNLSAGDFILPNNEKMSIKSLHPGQFVHLLDGYLLSEFPQTVFGVSDIGIRGSQFGNFIFFPGLQSVSDVPHSSFIGNILSG